jgi:hypothetical protein
MKIGPELAELFYSRKLGTNWAPKWERVNKAQVTINLIVPQEHDTGDQQEALPKREALV